MKTLLTYYTKIRQIFQYKKAILYIFNNNNTVMGFVFCIKPTQRGITLAFLTTKKHCKTQCFDFVSNDYSLSCFSSTFGSSAFGSSTAGATVVAGAIV